MPDFKEKRLRKIRHNGRGSQVLIYLGKQFRFFINQNDWKVLPMAAVIAGLVGMVIRRRFFVDMEGSMMGAFALTCVGIWNGCFNSIQSICRERAIVKREHRSGLHITAYVCAHMIYQLFLCMAQTGISMYVLHLIGVRFPREGFMTPFMILDIGITMLFISYAADMMSLLISSLSHTTTGAMTIMPFVLIFQLVFSGSIIPLPEWSRPLANFTISNYGIRAIASQSDYNSLPMVTPWKTLEGMKDSELGGTFTVGQVLDFLKSPGMDQYREKEILEGLSVGNAIDLLSTSVTLQDYRDKSFTVKAKLGNLINLAGEEKVKAFIQQKTSEAAYKKDYECTVDNIIANWSILFLYAVLFALLSVIVLEFIDKDKR